MSLKDLAQEMKSAGRRGDTELVHMTKSEVAGLHGLAHAAGGKLTINPKTGLPEASFLESLLPTILGFGAMFIPGMQPIGAAAIGAGAGALTNKDNPLMGALMGGLGAYGGAGLGAGLQGLAGGSAALNAQAIANPAIGGAIQSGAGSQAAMLAAQNAGMGSQALTGLSQAAGGAAPTAMQTLGAGAGAAASNPMSYVSQLGGPMATAKTAGMAAAPAMYDYMMPKPVSATKEEDPTLPEYEYTAGLTGDYYGTGGDFGTHERQYFTQPTFTRRMAEGGTAKAPMNSQGALTKLMGSAPAPAAPMPIAQSARPVATNMSGASAQAMRYLMGQEPSARGIQQVAPVQVAKPTATASSDRQWVYDTGTHSVIRNPNYVDPQIERDRLAASARAEMHSHSSFAKGGIVQLAKGGSVPLESGDFVVPADVVAYAGGGSTEEGYRRLNKKLGAIPLVGYGGGLDDHIEAHIDGRQPARVANGEMLIKQPGRAGTKKLYAMLDRIRKDAIGHTRQVKPVDLDRALA